MRAYRLTPEELAGADVAGRVLSRDVRGREGAVVLQKGQLLRADDASTLRDLEWAELHLIEVEAGDVDEDSAGRRIAGAAAGAGVETGTPSRGAWPLRARSRGILEVDVPALRRVNSVEGITVHTLLDGQVVDAGETVAGAKIVPLVLSAARVEEAEGAARSVGGPVRVRPFRRMRVAAVVQESLAPGQRARFREALGEKVAWLGSELTQPVHVDASEAALAEALDGVARAGADVVVLAGGQPLDPLDPAFAALRRLGLAPERQGAPIFPGSLFWIARLDDVPILGIPNCGLVPKATVLDVVLPRVLAGDWMGATELADLGHGGLLTRETSFRLPPYRPAGPRGEVPADA